jgi:hypothetical protein
LVLLAGAYVAWLRAHPALPTAPQALTRATEARAALAEVGFIVETPWPQANPPASGLPGARTLLGPVEGTRKWRVLWHRELGLRTELLEPAELRGTLTVLSPTAAWTYSPLLGVAMEWPPTSPAPLYFDEMLALVRAGVAPQAVAWTTVNGREALLIKAGVSPGTGAAAGSELLVELDRATWLPVRARLLDANGRVLGAITVSDVRLRPGATAGDFAFAPPAGSRVLAPGHLESFAAVDAVRPRLGFAPQQPAYLPAGFTLRAVNLLGQGDQTALVLTYAAAPADAGQTAGQAAGAGLISLTQALAGPEYRELPYGMPHRHGGWEGRQFELGEMRVLDWRSGPVALTLFGTTSLAELARVAASVR